MVFTLIIMVIILLVLTPVGIVVDKKIEAYFENKKKAEELQAQLHVQGKANICQKIEGIYYIQKYTTKIATFS